MPSPSASLALLEALQQTAGLRFDASRFVGAAARLRQRLDELVADNPEHRAMVDQLERQYDSEVASGAGGRMTGGEDLAAEVERFLREVGEDPSR
jgi:hypothetical protein